MPPTATLGGIPLTDQEEVGWQESYGTAPYTRTFLVHGSNAKRLEALLGTACELVIRPESGEALTWKSIWPLRMVPTKYPFHVAVMCCDVRWKWSRELLVRTYNMPRRTGNRRLVNRQVIELAIIKDDYTYVAATLKDGKDKWTPRTAVEDAMGALAEKCGHGWSVEDWPTGEGLAVEGLDLRHNGDVGMATLLAHAPGADVKINRDGDAVLKDATAYSATSAAVKSLIPTEAGQIARLVDLKHVRPKRITVWFDREVELRFDSVEEVDDPSATVQTGDAQDSQMLMENVLPLPDPETTIDGEVYAAGSYVPVRKALAAWNLQLSTLGKSPPPPELTIANVQKYWFVLDALYTALGNLVLDADQYNWSARISTLKAHYRKTYQIPAPWMAHIRDVRPYRLGILDPVTGARAAAQAWSQFCVEPTAKAYMQAALANDANLQFYWLNVDNYPGLDADLYDKSPSPAIVHVADRDLGILHIEYRTDPYGMRSAIHQSQMKENATGKIQAPTRDMREQLKGVMAVDGRVKGAIPIGLSSDFRVAVVVTALPIAPNSEDRMFPIALDPGEVGKSIAGNVQIEGGEGPEWHLACPPSLMTAWYALRETLAARESAPRLFGFNDQGLGVAGGVVGGGGGASDAPGYEIINLSDSRSLLQSIARAMAVAQWAAFVDAVEGNLAVHFLPSLALTGSMDAVKHGLQPDGRLLTEIAMGMARRPIDSMGLLPLPVRPIVLRIPEMHA